MLKTLCGGQREYHRNLHFLLSFLRLWIVLSLKTVHLQN